MKTHTTADIMALKPCEEYTDKRISELIGDGLTAEGIAALNIPVSDRIWCLIALLPEREQRLFACDCAERVLPIWEKQYPDDKRPRACIEAARRYAENPTDDNQRLMLAAARYTAMAAAYTADAAWEAAWAAAQAAMDAQRRWQLDRLVEYHKELRQ